MDELTIPFLGRSGRRWQYPFRSLRARRRGARDGLRLERLEREPAAGDGDRGQPRRPPRARASATTVPARRADRPGRRARGVHGGLGLGQPPRRTRPARSRSARRPTSPSSIATCSTAARAPIGEARVVGTFIDGVAVFEDAGARRLNATVRAGHGQMTMPDSAPDVGVDAYARRGDALSCAPDRTGQRKGEDPVNAYADLRRQRAPRSTCSSESARNRCLPRSASPSLRPADRVSGRRASG